MLNKVRGAALTARLNALLAERGIHIQAAPVCERTVTVYPSMAVVTRLAHAAADAKIAVDPTYDAMYARLDAELAEILEGVKTFYPLCVAGGRRAPHACACDDQRLDALITLRRADVREGPSEVQRRRPLRRARSHCA